MSRQNKFQTKDETKNGKARTRSPKPGVRRDTHAKGSSKPKGKSYRTGSAEEYAVESSTNDPQFYFKYPELMKHVTNIPFNVISNLPAPIHDGKFVNPSVVILEVNMLSPCTPNNQDTRNTNMNQFMQDFYAAVRRENSGARNYDPADLTRFIVAMAEVFKRINFLQRLYYMMNYYNPINRAFPIMLFKMMGINYDSFKNNQAEFAARLDTLITRASTMFVPSDIMFLKRIAMMFANYYIDTEDMRDTLYIPIPGDRGFLKLDDTENLVYDTLTVPPTGITMDTLMTNSENFVSSVLSSQDFGIMQGDIIKAFPNATFTKLQNLDPTYRMAPIFDKAMLMQYHNADVSLYSPSSNLYLGFDSTTGLPTGGYANTTDNYKMQLAPGYTLGTAVGKFPTADAAMETRNDAFLCLDSDTLTPEWIVECTRMKTECGVDYLARYEVYVPMDNELIDELITNSGYPYTATEIANLKGLFPYMLIEEVTSARYQHMVLQTWTYQNGASIPNINWRQLWGAPFSYITFGHRLNASTFRTNCRYVPYRVYDYKWYKNASAAGSDFTLLNSANKMRSVESPMPVIQPIDIPNLKRIDNVAWRSLLSW